MRATGLKTQLKLLPLLICCLSEPLFAAEAQPFVVAPELIRGHAAKSGSAARARDAAGSAAVVTPVPPQTLTDADELTPISGAAGMEGVPQDAPADAQTAAGEARDEELTAPPPARRETPDSQTAESEVPETPARRAATPAAPAASQPLAASPDPVRDQAARRETEFVADDDDDSGSRDIAPEAPPPAARQRRTVSPLAGAAAQPFVVSPDLIRSPAARRETAIAADDGRRAAPSAAGREQATAGVAAGYDLAEIAASAPPLGEGVTEVTAMRISGTQSVELVAEEDAVLRRDGITLAGDRLTYNELTDIARADGNVHLIRGTDEMKGPIAWLMLNERVGEFDAPVYKMTAMSRPTEDDDVPTPVTGRGHADKLHFDGENQYRLDNATWTTCEAPDPDWYLRAEELDLDYDTEMGVGRKGALVFKDVPILWWPKMSFPLVAKRQSGFLVPTMGMSNKTGVDISIPYYWNIAPNYDATIAPRYMGRRGLQLAGEARYMTETNMGEFRGEWLPKDSVTGESRNLVAWQHMQMLAPRLTAFIDYNAVSDDDYFEDLSSRVSVASKVNLLREGRLQYSGDWWSASAMAQSYQTLSGGSPYRRVPQILWNGHREDMPLGTVFSMSSEYVKFSNSERERSEGSRFIAHPSLSWPVVRPGYYITPKLSLHYTKYDLDRPLPGGRDSISRSIPITSIDTGLFFERDASFFGQQYEQTLEPRLLYVYAPYRNQEDIPVFDSAPYDFGFAQIFSENNYTGGDRIVDANQVTAAVTSRLINPETGGERLRVTLGQRFHFSDRRVTLNELGKTPVESLSDRSRTDWLAAFQGRVSQNVYVDSNWQYNPDDNLTQRFNTAVRYRPEYGKAFNVSYRYSRDILRDVDISSQWPLTKNLYGVVRLTRSLKESRLTEALGGIEYRGGCGCWVFRLAAHRFATSEEDTTQALFFQLELTGLGGVGPSPIKLLRRSVPGYGRINESPSDRYFGSD